MKGFVFWAGMMLVPGVAISTENTKYVPDEVKIHTASYHLVHRDQLEEDGLLNERNLGIGLKYNNVEFGAYRNSASSTTVYVIRDVYTAGSFVLFGGVAGGYLIPFVVGTHYTINNVQMSLLPGFTIGGRFAPVVSVSLVF